MIADWMTAFKMIHLFTTSKRFYDFDIDRQIDRYKHENCKYLSKLVVSKLSI